MLQKAAAVGPVVATVGVSAAASGAAKPEGVSPVVASSSGSCDMGLLLLVRSSVGEPRTPRRVPRDCFPGIRPVPAKPTYEVRIPGRVRRTRPSAFPPVRELTFRVVNERQEIALKAALVGDNLVGG